jgi:hypothetical protein
MKMAGAGCNKLQSSNSIENSNPQKNKIWNKNFSGRYPKRNRFYSSARSHKKCSSSSSKRKKKTKTKPLTENDKRLQ